MVKSMELDFGSMSDSDSWGDNSECEETPQDVTAFVSAFAACSKLYEVRV